MKYKQENVIEKLKTKHPRLDFSKFIYTNYKTKSIVICPIHGEFMNSCENLLRTKTGCLVCSKSRYKLTQEEAINNMKNKFPQFDYSKFEYKGINGKSIVVCHLHGEFEVSYKNFLNYHIHGCRKCARELVTNNQRKNIEEVMTSLLVKYPNLDFSLFEYTNYNSKSIVICPIHGEFIISYAELVSDRVKYGCPTCGRIISDNNRLLGRDYMIEKLNQKYPYYDFSNFNPKKTIDKSIIICDKHGEFESTFDYMMLRNIINPCPKCHISGYSKPEKEIVTFIKTFYNKDIEENNRNIILNEYTNRYLELDIYLPDIKLAIEFNGSYWHSDEVIKENKYGFNTAKEYHDYKFKKCEDKNIYLIHIDELDWIDNKDNILNNIKSMIENKNI